MLNRYKSSRQIWVKKIKIHARNYFTLVWYSKEESGICKISRVVLKTRERFKFIRILLPFSLASLCLFSFRCFFRKLFSRLTQRSLLRLLARHACQFRGNNLQGVTRVSCNKIAYERLRTRGNEERYCERYAGIKGREEPRWEDRSESSEPFHLFYCAPGRDRNR